MAISNIKVTLLCPIEKVWNKVTDLNDFVWRSDLSFEIENQNIKGTWVGKFYSHGDKTTLDFTENIASKKLIFKPFIGSYLKKQQKLYFRDLKKALNCEETSFVQKI